MDTRYFNAWKVAEKFLLGAGAAMVATAAGLGYDFIVGKGFDVQGKQVLVVFGAGALLGMKNYLTHKDKPSAPAGLPPRASAGVILLLVCLGATFSGCAFTQQHVRTMDGDRFDQFAGSTLGKQDSAQKVSADFYPNNSGSHIDVGGQTQQDTTAMVPIIQALVGALAQHAIGSDGGSVGGGSTEQSTAAKIEALTAEITRLRALGRAFNPDAVTP